MPPTATLTIGKGTKGATISGQTITWPRRRRQDHKSGNFVLNIDLGVNRSITGVTRDADNFITTTTVSGDISGWAPATEGLTTTINDTTTDVHPDTRTAALAVAADDRELILTPTEDFGIRFERITVANAIPMAFDGTVIEADEVGVRHRVVWPIDGGAGVGFIKPTTTTGSFIRDMWAIGGNRNAIIWTGNAAGTDTLTVERCIFEYPYVSEAVITADATGFAKNLTVNNCIFVSSSGTGSGKPVIEPLGALAHVVNINHCLLWRCGTAIGGDNALQTVNIRNTMIFGASGYNTQNSVKTYTTCIGDKDFGGGLATGVVESSEAEAFLLFQKSPGDPATNLWLTDYRASANALSTAFEAGTPVAGVTEDIDGRPRSLTKPSIGPAEGFPAFTEGVETSGSVMIALGIL